MEPPYLNLVQQPNFYSDTSNRLSFLLILGVKVVSTAQLTLSKEFYVLKMNYIGDHPLNLISKGSSFSVLKLQG